MTTGNASGWPSENDERPLDAEYDTRAAIERRGANMLKRRAKRRAQRGLRWALAAIGWLTRTPASDGPELRAGNPAIRRILVVRVDLIGDVVLSLPAVRVLRRAYPDARIDMLVLRSSAPILAAEGDLVAQVIPYDPGVWRRPGGVLKVGAWRDALALIRRLRAADYDLAVSISGDIGSILTRLSGARRRVGYADEAYGHFLTDTLPGGRYKRHQHEARYVLDLARAAGGFIQAGDEQLALHVLPEAETGIRRLLLEARRGRGCAGPVIALHAGARNGQAKRWPAGHFAALADRLVREFDALVVLTGGPAEEPIARLVQRQATAPILDLVGKTTLPELAALLAASDLLVTGDSGPMHIACAVNTPVVALHGPTDPALSGPTDPRALVLWRRLWCAPCYDASATAECRFGNPVCMKSLGPDLVFAAARRQLLRRNPVAHETLEATSHALPTS
ncbi:MAG TPA: lipopolysaccharide heptosyltransferase II [Ktedonobacterales bacterium]|nr:lipopolysaccharide heptosyltransferase II [Ktedonobacterales bacterium]